MLCGLADSRPHSTQSSLMVYNAYSDVMMVEGALCAMWPGEFQAT